MYPVKLCSYVHIKKELKKMIGHLLRRNSFIKNIEVKVEQRRERGER